MYLLLNKNETIVKIAENVTESGNLYYADGDGIVKSNLTKVEVDAVPVEVKEHKYNYNATDGFYLNPNYIEPVSRQELDSVKEQLALAQQAIDDLIFGGAL